MIREWALAGAVVLALALSIAAMRWLSGRLALHPELSRKLVHVLMGLVCLSFPWLFHSAWPVWGLALGAAAVLSAVRAVPALRERFGRVLGGVDRKSWGEFFFPLSVAFVFTLGHQWPLSYCIPILIMTVADATAALVGQKYGSFRYETDDGRKSIEGSMAFFFVTFFATHVPLLLLTHTGRTESLLIAVVLGLIVMLMEAISWRGLDNLFVPVVSYACLVRMIGSTVQELITRVVVLSVFLVAVLLWRRRTNLSSSAAVGAGLVLYLAWAVGDWHWLIAPLVTAAGYSFLCRGGAHQANQHRAFAVLAVGGIGICWLAAAHIASTVNTIYPYGVAYAANLGMLALAHFADERYRHSLFRATASAIAVGFVPMALTYLVIWRGNANALVLAGIAAVLVIVAVLLFALVQPSLRDCPADGDRFLRQALIACGVSFAAFAAISKIEPWSKSFL